MKILIIHNFYLQAGGEDSVVKTEKNLLETHGHTVDLLTFDNADIRSTWDKIAFGVKSIFNPSAYRQVKKRIQTFQPDIIHIHNFFYVGSPAIHFAAKSQNIPVVQTLHNYRLICPSAYLLHEGKLYEKSINKIFPWDAIRKRVWNNSLSQTTSMVLISGIHKLLGTWRNKVDGYIVFTEFAKSLFLHSSLKVDESRFFIKPNFVEDNGYQTTSRTEEFVFVGRLSPEKGIAVLLEATRHAEFNLRIIGDGPERPLVEAYAKENPRIRFDGLQDRSYVFTQLKQCRAMIFPSLWYEGMPMTIVEAFSTGTPLIASRLGNPGIMITEEKNGLLFDPGDPEDLAKKIIRLQQEEGLPEQLSQGARQIYADQYTPEKNYEVLMGIYQAVQNREKTG